MVELILSLKWIVGAFLVEIIFGFEEAPEEALAW